MAITHSYVDYGAGSDATGDGTVGTPWKTLQKAFDTLTRNTTDGNQVNLKAGTAHVNSAALDLTTFIAGGALAAAAPLILRGYTSAANDGGIGEIDCGGATMWAASSYDYISLIDLEMHTFGNNDGVYIDQYSSAINCEVHKGASTPSNKHLLRFGSNSIIASCYVHDANTGGVGIYAPANGFILNNYIANCPSGTYGATNVICIRNIFLLTSTDSYGIQANTRWIISGNIVYNTTAGTLYGIKTTSDFCATVNNIVVGFSGSGGEGIWNSATNPQIMVGWNAFYNNTAAYTEAGKYLYDAKANDVSLAANPFTDAANGDFSLTAAAKTALAAKGWPTSYLGAHANTVPNLNIGPIQLAASAGGGGRPAFGDRSGGKF